MKQENLSHQNDGIGESYKLGKDFNNKYDDKKEIIQSIKRGLAEFVFADPAVRFVLANKSCNPVRTILGLPFEAKIDEMLENFAKLIYRSLLGYYLQADSKTTHFGLFNGLIEGDQGSLLQREMEKLIDLIQKRDDLAGRLLENIEITDKINPPEISSNLISETIRGGLEIQVGYRVFIRGENVNPATIFIPIEEHSGIIDQIFQNLEEMLQRAFNVYDEIGSGYLDLSENLIYKDLESILDRSKEKEFTRKKILNKLAFDVFAGKEDSSDYRDAFYKIISNSDNSEIEGVSRYFASNFDYQNSATVKKRKSIRKKKETSKLESEEEHRKVPARPENVAKDNQLSADFEKSDLEDNDKSRIIKKEDGSDILLQKESIQELKE